MKLVRRMSLLVALALVLTVGGVYAAWIYSNTNATGVDVGFAHSMAAVSDEKTPNGTIAIVTNSAALKVDQKAAGDYTAVLAFEGSIVVSFTPADGATDDVVANAIPVAVTAEILHAAANQYEGKDIYSAGETVQLEWVKQDSGAFHATLDAEDFAKLIKLGDFELPTIDDYNAFKALEREIGIRLLINPVEAQ